MHFGRRGWGEGVNLYAMYDIISHILNVGEGAILYAIYDFICDILGVGEGEFI
ncbi:MAG: hypothetical protein IPG02_00925 [Ignavibacteria bacterium]|jgi:hypothetical protein|nr:hypothetical protein [Ignavibacteria bacterium]MBK9226455.1 hypothetical protein [Ignavibacteria bacterium]